MVDLTNQMRAQNGLSALAVDSRLMQMAQIQAQNMARFKVLDHTLPQAAQPDLQSRASYVGYAYSTLGENIAFNYNGPSDLIDGWMGSAPHRANILNSSFTQIGVALAYDSSGNPYYCEVFGAPQ
jgi:uncharacterized protein YkwD